jgi:hypothetical protein
MMRSVSVVDTVAVQAVMEARSECSDRERAEAALIASVSSARAPRRLKDGPDLEKSGEAAAAGRLGRQPQNSQSPKRWRLEMRVGAAAPGIKSADARIEDDAGHVIAERSVSDKTVSCMALARAVGAWAQIVLDDELLRAHEAAERHVDLPLPETQPIVVTTSASTPAEAIDALPTSEGPAKEEKPPLEVGTTMFLRNGVAESGGIFGASPFVTFGLSKTLVLRPSFIIGTSTSRVPPDASQSANLTMIGGRIDFCRRFPGNYLDHRGIEFDGCAGSDFAYVTSDLDRAFRASVGPSAILRGELGSNFGLELRGMVGANLARSGLGPVDAPFVVADAEVGASVRFR